MVAEAEAVGAAGARPREAGPWRWTVDLYEQAAQAGVFEGQRVELVNGEIIHMSPMGEPHAVGMNKVQRQFNRKLPDALFVRGQAPLYINRTSAPVPDIAVVDTSDAEALVQPTTAHLVVEYSDATLRSDRTTKASLYASAQIAEYWIVNVNARTLEVLREPIEDDSEPSGWRYGQTQVLREDASISPLCAPEVEFTISEMLP